MALSPVDRPAFPARRPGHVINLHLQQVVGEPLATLVQRVAFPTLTVGMMCDRVIHDHQKKFEITNIPAQTSNESMNDNVLLSLTRDEALVSFEWLAGLDSKNVIPCDDHSEEVVLWRLHAQLEKVLVEPFSPNYRDLLDSSRKAVTESE